MDAFHRQHAIVELAIRDIKEGSGLEHMPSGDYAANGAWLRAQSSPTICAAGPPFWASSPPTTGSRWPAPCAPGSSRSRAASSAARVSRPCARPTASGPGLEAFIRALERLAEPAAGSSSELTSPRPAHRRRRHQALTSDLHHMRACFSTPVSRRGDQRTHTVSLAGRNQQPRLLAPSIFGEVGRWLSD